MLRALLPLIIKYKKKVITISKNKTQTRTIISILSILLVCMISMSSIGLAFQSPISQDVIIQYGNSQEELRAISIIQRQTGATVISVDSPLLSLKLQRSFGMVFVVGHGSEDGIMDGKNTEKWSTVAHYLRFESSNVILVSCDSEQAAEEYGYVGFPDNVDASLAAYIASAYYFAAKNMQIKTEENIENAKQRITELMINPSLSSFLTFSREEIGFGIFFILLGIIGVALSAVSKFGEKVSRPRILAVLVAGARNLPQALDVAISYLIVTLNSNGGDGDFSYATSTTLAQFFINTFIEGFNEIMPWVLSLFRTGWDALSWASKALVGLSFLVDLAVIVSGSGFLKSIQLGLAVASLIVTFALTLRDFFDCDGSYGVTKSCSSGGGGGSGPGGPYHRK